MRIDFRPDNGFKKQLDFAVPVIHHLFSAGHQHRLVVFPTGEYLIQLLFENAVNNAFLGQELFQVLEAEIVFLTAFCHLDFRLVIIHGFHREKWLHLDGEVIA